MRRRLIYLRGASRNLLEILDYIADASGSVGLAHRFVATLRRKCLALSRNPAVLGTARPEIRPDIRSFPYRGYVIFFRYVENRFEVVNILEGRRDVVRHITHD